MAARTKKPAGEETPADPDKLKRERAGTYRSADGRFTVEQTSSGWLLLDEEHTNELGLSLARGPYSTLDEARTVLGRVRADPTPISDLAERRAAREQADRADDDAAQEDGASAGNGKGRDRKHAPASSTRAGSRAARVKPKPSGPTVSIREFRTVDGDALRALWKAAGFRSLGDDDKSLARFARRNPGLLLVAAEGTKIVGSALGAWDGRRGWIYHVATAESHRRQGIATRMVEQVEAGLRDLGCPKVNVVVRNENDGARVFWTKRGYEPGSRQYGKELGR